MSIDKDIVINKGATFSYAFTVSGDLSAATLSCKGRLQHGLSATAWTATVSAVHSGNTTTFTISLPAATTLGLIAPSTGVWDMETNLSGTITRQIEGAYFVTPEVTT